MIYLQQRRSLAATSQTVDINSFLELILQLKLRCLSRIHRVAVGVNLCFYMRFRASYSPSGVLQPACWFDIYRRRRRLHPNRRFRTRPPRRRWLALRDQQPRCMSACHAVPVETVFTFACICGPHVWPEEH